MKILYFTHYSELYGANLSLLYLIKELMDRYNIQPLVIVPTKGNITDKFDESKINYKVVKFHSWAYPCNFKNRIKLPIRLLYNKIKIYYLARTLKREKFDLIHTNSSVIDIGCRLSLKMNKPHVWHIREFGFDDYGLKFPKGDRKAYKYIYDHSDSIIAISNSILDHINSYIPSNKTKLIYNGIFFKGFKQSVNNKNMDQIKFVVLSYISDSKSQLTAIKALSHIVNELNIKNIHLTFIGDGDTKYIESLKNYCYSNNLNDYVDFKGYIPNNELNLQHYNVGISCSKKEAFGRVIVEYMLNRLPVIASNSGGFKEIIDNGKNGFLYDIDDYFQLANYMLTLVNNKDLIVNFGENGFNKAIENYLSSANAKKIYEVYNSIKANSKS